MKTFLLVLLFPLSLRGQEPANQTGNSPIPGFETDAPQTEDNLIRIQSELQGNDQSARSLIAGGGNNAKSYNSLTIEKLEGIIENLRDMTRDEDKQALRDLKAIYEKAIAQKDLDLIKPHLAEDFTAVMITADEVSDYDGIKAYWKKVEEFIGKDGTYTVTIEPDDTIFEGDIAIAKGIAKEHVVRNGKTIDLTSKWTAIARREGDSWKLVRIQASIDPVKNPIIDVLNKGKLWLTGGVAGIVGLILGWLFGRRKK